MKTFALVNGDLVHTTLSGSVILPEGAIEVPETLANVPYQFLRVKGGEIVDARTLTTFYVDPDGTKHAINGTGRQKIDAAFESPIVRDGDRWRAQPAEEVKANALASYAGRRRSEVEAGGMDWSGNRVDTSAESLLKIASERLAVLTGDREDGEVFFFLTGPAPLSNEAMSDLATAARNRSKVLIAKEAELRGKIAAGQITEFSAIDSAFEGL